MLAVEVFLSHGDHLRVRMWVGVGVDHLWVWMVVRIDWLLVLIIVLNFLNLMSLSICHSFRSWTSHLLILILCSSTQNLPISFLIVKLDFSRLIVRYYVVRIRINWSIIWPAPCSSFNRFKCAPFKFRIFARLPHLSNLGLSLHIPKHILFISICIQLFTAEVTLALLAASFLSFLFLPLSWGQRRSWASLSWLPNHYS